MNVVKHYQVCVALIYIVCGVNDQLKARKAERKNCHFSND